MRSTASERTNTLLRGSTLERVNRELGTATAVITHNAAIAAMADRVVRIADGRIVDVRANARKARVGELQW